MKKRLFAILSALLISCTAAGAQDIPWQECSIAKDGTVTVEDTLKSKQANAKVSMVVYYPGKSSADLQPETETDAVVSSDQTSSGLNGAYTFEFKVNGPSDFYNVEIASEYAEDSKTFRVLYSNPATAAALLSDLNSAQTAESFYNIIYGENKGWKDLGFYVELSDKADEKKVSDILYETVKNEPFDTEDIQGAISKFRKAYMEELLNESKTVTASELDRFGNISSLPFNSYYEKSYITDSVKNEIINGLKGNGFKDINALDDAILEQVVLKNVTYGDGIGVIKDILTEYAAKTGIDASGYSSSSYQKVLGNTYNDYADLEKALKAAKENATAGGSTGGSSGGGSGKNNNPIGSNGISIASPLIDTYENTPVKKTYFNDIENYSWAGEAIEYLAKNEIISGKSEGEFCPSDNILREEFTLLAVKAFKISGGDSEAEFSDVEPGSWYESSVKTASSKGIISGIGDGMFGVSERITRQDMAVIIARILNIENEEDSEFTFTDDGQIADYAKSSVYAMKSMGIISGFEDGSFCPSGYATRAEAAVMIYKALSLK